MKLTAQYHSDLLDRFEELTVNVQATKVIDNNYGADADGNRGIRQTWLEDVEITSVEDDSGKDVLKDLTNEEHSLLLNEAERKADFEEY